MAGTAGAGPIKPFPAQVDGGGFVADVPKTLTAIQIAQGGEGGEAGEKKASNTTAEQAFDFVHYLRTVEARIHVAKALYDAGETKDALYHFKRVVRYLNDKNAKKFAKSMKFDHEHWAAEASVIPQLIESKAPKEQVADLYAHMLEEVDENLFKVAAALRRSPEMVVAVNLAMLKHAVREYDQVMKNGKIVKPHDWQAARALVWTARNVFGSAAATLVQSDKERVKAILEAFDSFQEILAPLKAPQKMANPSVFRSLVGRIELQTSGLAKPIAEAGAGGEGGEGGEGGAH